MISFKDISRLLSQPVASKRPLAQAVSFFYINISLFLAQINPVLSTFLGIFTPNCPQAVATLHMFPSGRGDQRVDLALEEAGLTPALAESTLPVRCLGHTQGGCLGDESPVAWVEMDPLLSPQLAGVTAEVAAGRREAGECRAEHLMGHTHPCWMILMQTSAPKVSTGITEPKLFTFTASLFSSLCSGSCPHLGGLPAASLYLVS